MTCPHMCVHTNIQTCIHTNIQTYIRMHVGRQADRHTDIHWCLYSRKDSACVSYIMVLVAIPTAHIAVTSGVVSVFSCAKQSNGTYVLSENADIQCFQGEWLWFYLPVVRAASCTFVTHCMHCRHRPALTLSPLHTTTQCDICVLLFCAVSSVQQY